jgi:O-antigen ligase
MVIFLRPNAGFAIMLLLIPLEQVFIINQSVTVIRVIGIAVFSGWLLRTLLGGQKIRTGTSFWLLVIYLIWCFSSAAWAEDAGSSINRLGTAVQLVAFYFIGCNLINCRDKLNFFSTFYLIGVLAAVTISIFSSMASDFTTRASISELQDPNWYARALGAGLILSIYMIASSARFIHKISFFGVGAASLAGILLSGSRGTWLTLVATLAIAVILTKNLKLKLLVIMLALTFTIFSGTIIDNLPAMVGNRITSIGEDMGDRGSGRLDIWMVGCEMVKDNYLIGVGFDNFPKAYNSYLVEAPPEIKDRGVNRDPHSTLLSIAAELGAVGFMLFIAMLASSLAVAKGASNDSVRILGISLVIYLISGSLALTEQSTKYFWFALIVPNAIAFFPGEKRRLEGNE